MGRSNYTTLLLIFIVILLLLGVGIAIYYVLGIEWFKKPEETCNEQYNGDIKIQKEVKYDITKRIYNIKFPTDNMQLVVYKDGTVGITITEAGSSQQVDIYKETLNKEIRIDLRNIIRAYEIEVSTEHEAKTYIVLLDIDGNLYKQEKQKILVNGDYLFKKIEGLTGIIDVMQITNDELTDNTNFINAIAVDKESNELLLTNYLLK